MARARILAVDHQVQFRRFFEDLLASEGYGVVTAASPEEALHLLERERFDVVVTDLLTPAMPGGDFVARIKESWPDQDVVVVTGAADVRTAVDAMRRGATDYVLKPVDRTELARSLEAILQRRRLRQERGRLLAENIEFLGMLSVYERALGFLSTLAIEPLADRIVEGLCLQTRAQGGVLWLARLEGAERLHLLAARGLVRVEQEPEEIDLEQLPAGLAGLRGVQPDPFVADAGEPGSGVAPGALIVPLCHAGTLLGFARLTDKLAGGAFEARDCATAERLAEPAAIAAANALRHRSLEKRTFRDPTTKAYTRAFFEDVLRNELEKASRFARGFSLLRLEIEGLGRVREKLPDASVARWLEGLVARLAGLLRASDLLAQESEHRYALLLPETDAVGAAVLKRRMREALERSGLLQPSGAEAAVQVRLASATYPVDGTQIEMLERVLEGRLVTERNGLLERLGLAGLGFGEAIDALAVRAEPVRSETLEQIFRLALDEADRRAGERGVLCLAPGHSRLALAREALSRLDPVGTRIQVVLVADSQPDALTGTPVTCVSTRRARTQRPFLLYYAEGASYLLVADPKGSAAQSSAFHTSERALIEHLAFQLQRDLGVPVGR